MFPPTVPLHPVYHRLLARGLAAVALVGVALVHLMLLPHEWEESPGLGAMFTVLVVAATVTSGAIVAFDNRLVWLAAVLIGAAPIAGYVLTRSTAVPFAEGDVGNWLEPAGLAALFLEAWLVALAANTLRPAFWPETIEEDAAARNSDMEAPPAPPSMK
jgi:hypothetical protein